MKLEIQKWLTDFSGCSGGNIGSKENPSIWLCGIEYGGGWDEEGLRHNIYEEKWENNPQFGHLEFDNYPYTQILYKLLYALAGSDDLGDYKNYARENEIFMQDSPSPYFKMNLYPIAFNKFESEWSLEYTEITGFQDKDDYIRACKEHRFPMMRQWVQIYQPKLIICFGKGLREDFNLAFRDNDDDFSEIKINKLSLFYKVNNNGTIIVVLPFPNTQYGLKSYDDIWAMGVFLRGLLNNK